MRFIESGEIFSSLECVSYEFIVAREGSVVHCESVVNILVYSGAICRVNMKLCEGAIVLVRNGGSIEFYGDAEVSRCEVAVELRRAGAQYFFRHGGK